MKKLSRVRKITRMVLPAVYALALAAGVIGRNFTFMIIILVSGLLAGPFYCGWACPFGALQEWTGRLGRLLRIPRFKVPDRIEKWLRFSRYLLLGLSFTGLMFTLTVSAPYDGFMGFIAGNASRLTAAAWILLGLTLLSALLIERPFCRYLCPEGARYGLASLARIFTIRRDKDKCISCGACDRKCPVQVRISDKRNVRNFQCINCLECIDICPVENTLSYGIIFRKNGVTNEKKQSQ